jgi:hypothetical protein
VKQVWYPANKDAKTLPFPSAFMSRDWVPDPEECTGVGEVYGASRNFNYKKPIPGATGEHICGTADQFAGLAHIDFDQDVKYRANGLPVCCGVGALVGGLLVGGKAAVNYTPPAPGPSARCESAPRVDLGTPFGATINPGGPEQWWRFVPTSAETRLTWLQGDINTAPFLIYQPCPGGNLVTWVENSPTVATIDTRAGAGYGLRIYNPSGAPQPYRIRLDPA